VFQQVRDETARILDGTTLAAAAGSSGLADDEPVRHDVIQLGNGQ
jgi:hypothetical protein